jgi:cytidine deaminase
MDNLSNIKDTKSALVLTSEALDNLAIVEHAKKAMKFAYAPYSKFHVGVALVTASGKLYTGCNVENAAYGSTICAERVAVAKAVSEGDLDFKAIAIVGSSNEFTYPCGSCRQFISEFGINTAIIVQAGDVIREHKMRELLPCAFVTFSL